MRMLCSSCSFPIRAEQWNSSELDATQAAFSERSDAMGSSAGNRHSSESPTSPPPVLNWESWICGRRCWEESENAQR